MKEYSAIVESSTWQQKYKHFPQKIKQKNSQEPKHEDEHLLKPNANAKKMVQV